MTLLRKYGVLALGAVLTVAGAVLMLTQPVSFGWTAYAPLSSNTFVPPWASSGMIAGFLLLVLGLVAIAGWVGFRLGRRVGPSAFVADGD